MKQTPLLIFLAFNVQNPIGWYGMLLAFFYLVLSTPIPITNIDTYALRIVSHTFPLLIKFNLFNFRAIPQFQN